MINTTVRRIYVASLSDYNDGRLHGRWIDLDGCDLDDVWKEINEMLRSSPVNSDPFYMQYGMKAEEWAIHDYEGFFDYRLSEYESIEKVVKLAAFLDEHGEAGAAFLSNQERDPETWEDDFNESYAGSAENAKDFAFENVCELGFPGVGFLSSGVARYIPSEGHEATHRDIIDQMYSYIDWDAVIRDLEGDGWSFEDSDGFYHFFRYV